jgi:hypothetical protein
MQFALCSTVHIPEAHEKVARSVVQVMT